MLSLSTIIELISSLGPSLPAMATEAENVFNDIAHGKGGLAKIERVIADLEGFGKAIVGAVSVAQSVRDQNAAANVSSSAPVTVGGG